MSTTKGDFWIGYQLSDRDTLSAGQFLNTTKGNLGLDINYQIVSLNLTANFLPMSLP